MKIQNVKGNQIEVPVSYSHIQEEKNIEIAGRQSSDVEIVNQNISLKEKILAIQRVKTSLGIESLAASDLYGFWESDRSNAAVEMGNRVPPRLGDFEQLELCLFFELEIDFKRSTKVITAVSRAMAAIAKKLDPSEFKLKVSTGKAVENYSGSNLMKLATCDYSLSRNNYYDWNQSLGSREAVINAGQALRTILEKIGDKLPDEAEIIRLLLNAPQKEVCEQGVLAAVNTYKHKWRKNIQDTGLITALKKEENDNMRSQIAYAIAHGDPKSILESHAIDGSSQRFSPVTRLMSDRSYGVRRNLLWGVTEVFDAQRQKGNYYETFKEIPELTARNRIDSFDVCLKIIEILCSISSPTKNDLSMLHNSCFVIFYSIGDEAIKNVQVAGLQGDYERVERRLLQLDIIRFVRLTTQPEVDDLKLNTWNLAYRAVERALYLKSKSHDKPLAYFFQLKTSIKQLIESTREPKTVSNLENALGTIDNAIEHYITNTPVQRIRWGECSEFNSTVKDLLDLFERSQKDSCKIAVLDLLARLNQNVVCLEGGGNVSLDDVLDDSNKSRLKEILRNAIHSKPVTKELLLNPPTNTFQGKALTVYRTLPHTKSFKDYYGMSDLKTRAIEMAVKCIEDSKFSCGLLLSGAAGTGKSLFGEVLANEIGVPLELLISSKANEGESGEVLFFENNRPFTVEQYFERIKKIGKCVLLVDEIDEITSPKDTNFTPQVLSFFQKLREARLPIIVIATTNRPILDSTYGIAIREDGSSDEFDSSLKEYVHPDLFDFLKPCYLFHQKSVVEYFAKGYLENLSKACAIKGGIDLQKASRLARTLTPLKIINSLKSILEHPLSSESIVNELRKLRLESGITKHQESIIRSTIQILLKNGTHCMECPIDCIELALAAEDAPAELIFKILSNSPSILNQNNLLRLLSDALSE